MKVFEHNYIDEVNQNIYKLNPVIGKNFSVIKNKHYHNGDEWLSVSIPSLKMNDINFFLFPESPGVFKRLKERLAETIIKHKDKIDITEQDVYEVMVYQMQRKLERARKELDEITNKYDSAKLLKPDDANRKIPCDRKVPEWADKFLDYVGEY